MGKIFVDLKTFLSAVHIPQESEPNGQTNTKVQTTFQLFSAQAERNRRSTPVGTPVPQSPAPPPAPSLSHFFPRFPEQKSFAG